MSKPLWKLEIRSKRVFLFFICLVLGMDLAFLVRNIVAHNWAMAAMDAVWTAVMVFIYFDTKKDIKEIKSNVENPKHFRIAVLEDTRDVDVTKGKPWMVCNVTREDDEKLDLEVFRTFKSEKKAVKFASRLMTYAKRWGHEVEIWVPKTNGVNNPVPKNSVPSEDKKDLP